MPETYGNIQSKLAAYWPDGILYKPLQIFPPVVSCLVCLLTCSTAASNATDDLHAQGLSKSLPLLKPEFCWLDMACDYDHQCSKPQPPVSSNTDCLEHTQVTV